MNFSFLKIAENFADIQNANIPERGDVTFSIGTNDFKVPRLNLIDSDKLINKTKQVLSKYKAEIVGVLANDGGEYSAQEAGMRLMSLIDSMLSQDDVNALKYELCAATSIKLDNQFLHLRENLINSHIKSRDDLMAIALIYLEVNAAGFFSQRLITSLLSRAQTAE